ncbi:phosphopantetheine-binding protein [Streptomyces sp. NPDC047000]|uniref:phosphopantetheine-binding protein n=1 Tax=Streptomyces sp. NPDC047000 TaxID=3155474 RepID=UPI00340D5057
MEQELAELWEERLEIRGVGVEDDFWECGGDSLCFIEIVEVLNQEYGVRLGFFDIGASVTIARLAALVRERSPR